MQKNRQNPTGASARCQARRGHGVGSRGKQHGRGSAPGSFRLRNTLNLVVARGNPKRVAGLADIARPDIRFINRPTGTGTRLLLDQALQELGINPFDVHGYGEEVGTHLEVGIAVLTDRADAGLATLSIAHLLRLDFVPLRDERYDRVIPESLFFEPGVQTVLEVLRSKSFAEEIERSGGYQSQETGRVLARLTSCT